LFSKNAIETILADVALEEINRAFVEHWLSLWQGNELPARTQLNPAKMKRFLTKMAILDVVPDRGVTVRLAGTGLTAVLEMELSGKDWIALAPEHYRKNGCAYSPTSRAARLVSAVAGSIFCTTVP